MSLRNLLSEVFGTASGASGADTPRQHHPFIESVLGAERELWGLVIAAMLMDVTLTVHGLQIGLREVNPVAVEVLDMAGAVGLYLMKGGALLVGLVCRPLLPSRYTALIPLGLAIPSLFAVIHNSALILWVLIWMS